MTALLACDGCGNITSARPEDDDPTATWWCLYHGPVIGGGTLKPLSIETFVHIDLDEPVPEPAPERAEPPEPERHFCCLECIGAWVSRRGDTGAP